MNQTKVCTKCGQAKSFSEFHKNKRSKDGLATHCKPCHVAYAKTDKAKEREKAWRDSCKEERSRKNKEYRRKNEAAIKARRAAVVVAPEVKAARSDYKRAWWASNKDSVYARQRKWMESNPDKARAPKAKWAAANPAALRAITLRRRARLIGAEVPGEVVSKFHLIALLQKQGNSCNYCKKDIASNYTVDHIVPLVKGGKHEVSNLQLLCRNCNSKKSYLDEAVFLERRGYEAPQRSPIL